MESNIIFVTNIPSPATSFDVADVFLEKGYVPTIIVTEPEGQKSIGSCYLELRDALTLKKALQEIGELTVFGKKVRIEFPEKANERSAVGF
jgi:hypothetical protein